MNRFFITEEIVANTVTLSGEVFHHMKNVLKLQKDEQIILIKNKKELLCNIDKIEKDSIIVSIQKELECHSENPFSVTLFQGIPKSDKMDFIVEKAVEAGATSVVPLKLSRSIAKIEGKDVAKKLERYYKIAKSAAQQSGRLIIPAIAHPVSLKEADFSVFDLKLVCYEDEEKTTLKQVLSESDKPQNIAVVIGPEGGISPQEVELLIKKGFRAVSLGSRILRCETAGLYTLANINYQLG